jgi:NAD(P)-dependent dehydrogenase (short-subunit alcohol dehydrogenase family)
MSWTTADIPDQSGRVAIVTGANSGLGLETTEGLLAAGATVIMACRDVDKARRVAPAGGVVAELDLTSIESVQEFTQWFGAEYDRLDLLINNAGVMHPPASLTAMGAELQWATNHLGHFALTGLLLPTLTGSEGSRVVNVSSLAAGGGDLTHFDPTSLDNYSRGTYYSNSKLANQVFTVEFNRRLSDGDGGTIAVAAHPGVSATNLTSSYGLPGPLHAGLQLVGRVVLQGADAGALPSLRAATDPDVEANHYFGPDGRGQVRGKPVKVPLQPQATDAEVGRRLWQQSMELTGVEYLTE